MAIPAVTCQPQGNFRITAGEALTAYRFVKIGGVYADANETMLGVTQQDWSNGDEVTLYNAGTVILETSEAVTAGDLISAANDGKGKVRDVAEKCYGYALNTITGAGYIELLISPVG